MSHPANTPASGGDEKAREDLIFRARLAATSENTLYGGTAGDLYNDLADALAAQPPKADGGVVPLERVRHVKRGTEYEVLGEASLQIATDVDGGPADGRRMNNYDPVMVHRSLDTGCLWVRPYYEFKDGRFEAAAPPLNTGSEVGGGGEPRRMAEGCCSAISPCSHQQRDPYSICGICQKSAGLAAKIAAAPEADEEARELAASERISAAQVAYDEAMEGYDPSAPDHEVQAFDAMKAAIAVADALRPAPAEAGEDLQADLRELLKILGMGDHARPQSPHEVFQEALGVLRASEAGRFRDEKAAFARGYSGGLGFALNVCDERGATVEHVKARITANKESAR